MPDLAQAALDDSGDGVGTSTPSASSTSADPAARRLRAVAVLGDGARRAPRRRSAAMRRDVERAARRRRRCRRCRRTTPARTRTRHRARAHRARRADDLVDGLALHAQRDQQAADLRRRRLAVHDLPDDRRPSRRRVRCVRRRVAAPRATTGAPSQRRVIRPSAQEVARAASLPSRSGSTRGGTARPRPAASCGAAPMISPSRGARRDLEARRAATRALDHQRVVARGLERARQPANTPCPVVARSARSCRA